MKVRITFCKLGGKSAVAVVDPGAYPVLVKTAANKLRFKVKRLFIALSGTEVTAENCSQVVLPGVKVIATKGEEYHAEVAVELPGPTHGTPPYQVAQIDGEREVILLLYSRRKDQDKALARVSAFAEGAHQGKYLELELWKRLANSKSKGLAYEGHNFPGQTLLQWLEASEGKARSLGEQALIEVLTNAKLLTRHAPQVDEASDKPGAQVDEGRPEAGEEAAEGEAEAVRPPVPVPVWSSGVTYFIACTRKDTDTLRHELMHAFYHSHAEYRLAASQLLLSLPAHTQSAAATCMKSRGYAPHTHIDEFQAYLCCDDHDIVGGKKAALSEGVIAAKAALRALQEVVPWPSVWRTLLLQGEWDGQVPQAVVIE